MTPNKRISANDQMFDSVGSTPKPHSAIAAGAGDNASLSTSTRIILASSSSHWVPSASTIGVSESITADSAGSVGRNSAPDAAWPAPHGGAPSLMSDHLR